MGQARVGIAGKRGLSCIHGLRSVEGVEAAAFFDPSPEAQALAAELGVPASTQSYEELLDRVDAVVVASPMHLHASQAIAAMEAGKHVLSEVTAAVTLDECWQLMDAFQRSSADFMFAENYCYFEENLLVKELVRRGDFGSPVFGEGEYVHEVRSLHFHADGSPTWRRHWQAGPPGNTYITHELGPVMQWFQAADQFNRVETVCCMGSGAKVEARSLHEDTSITLCKLTDGSLIKIRLDMMSSRPEMICYSLQGTHGVYESGRGEFTQSRVWFGSGEAGEERRWRPLEGLWDALPAELRGDIEQARSSGHGGGDWFVGREFALLVRDRVLPELDIHAALHWTAVGLCSQVSAVNGGVPVRVPDFADPSQRPAWMEGAQR